MTDAIAIPDQHVDLDQAAVEQFNNDHVNPVKSRRSGSSSSIAAVLKIGSRMTSARRPS
jgi:hypothetical protein